MTGRRAVSRRVWLRGAGALGGGVVLAGVAHRTLGAQETPAANFAPMEQGAYRPTLRDPKPGATPRLSDAERDALEHRLKCQCGCILDIYTCRTTDFTCQVSPAMHRDVVRLIAGGYDAQEILDAFVSTYGEVALTAPKKEGFNWAGYLTRASRWRRERSCSRCSSGSGRARRGPPRPPAPCRRPAPLRCPA